MKSLEEIINFVLENTYSFCSTQVELEDSIKDKVLQFVHSIEDVDIFAKEGFGREEIPHITIKYGIHREPSDKEIKNILNLYGKKKINVVLNEISSFSTDEYDVLIVNAISEDLKKLNKIISENLKVTDTYPTYKPHMTLAYMKKGTIEHYLKNKNIFKGEILEFNKFYFCLRSGEQNIIKL